MGWCGLQVLEEEVEAALKEAAVVSMGTEVSEHDMLNIGALCDQVSAARRVYICLGSDRGFPATCAVFRR